MLKEKVILLAGIFLFATISILFLNSCAQTTSTSSSPSSSPTPEASSGWTVIASSLAGEPLVTPSYGNTNRVTSGLGAAVAGEFDISYSLENQNVGWMVGNVGDVLKTVDGGTNADYVNIGTGGRLQSVFALTNNKIWISGKDTNLLGSSIFYSEDGGTTWEVLVNTAILYPGRSNTSLDRINSLAFTSESSVLSSWAVGGLTDNTAIILKASDADGKVWQEVYRSSGSDYDELFSIAYFDKNNLIAVGRHGMILTSDDSGTSWNSRTSGTDKILYEVRTTGTSTAYAVGETGTVLKSTDKGVTWNAIDISSVTVEDLYALSVRQSKIWAGGYNGAMIYSGDSGSTWSTQESNTTGPIQSILMLSDTLGWAVAANTSSYTGAIIKTTSGGVK